MIKILILPKIFQKNVRRVPIESKIYVFEIYFFEYFNVLRPFFLKFSPPLLKINIVLCGVEGFFFPPIFQNPR